MRIARVLATAVVFPIAASLVSCSSPAPIPRPAAASDTPAATAPAQTPAAVEIPTETPWFAVRAERPVALLDALDQARGEDPGTLARWLFGAAPTAPDEPLRAWLVGEAESPSLWISWAGAPASPSPGALLTCDGAAHVCATRPADLARAAAFASAQPGDAKAAAPSQEPAIVATFPKAGLDRAVPSLLGRAAGVIAQLAEAGAGAKNLDPATLEPLLSTFRNRSMVENQAHAALVDVEQADMGLGVAPGGFRFHADVHVGESSPVVARLGSPLLEDGVAPSTLARWCPADSHLVVAMRQRAEKGAPLVPVAMALQSFADGLHDERFTKSLRSAWDATTATTVTCQVWGPDGKTVSHAILALRDAKAAARALAQVNPLHVKSGELKIDLQRSGKTVSLDVKRGAEAYSIAIGVVGDSLVLILADKAGKRLDALRAAPPLAEAPLVNGLEAGPFVFGVNLSKVLRQEGDATVRGRIEVSAPGHLRATVHASAGMIAFLSRLSRGLQAPTNPTQAKD